MKKLILILAIPLMMGCKKEQTQPITAEQKVVGQYQWRSGNDSYIMAFLSNSICVVDVTNVISGVQPRYNCAYSVKGTTERFTLTISLYQKMSQVFKNCTFDDQGNIIYDTGMLKRLNK